MTTDRRPLHLLLAGFAALALLLASCSSSGSDDAADDKETTTTEAGGSDDDTPTTTEADEPADGEEGATQEQLEAVLPTAADLGAGWEEDTSDDDGDDESDQIIEEQCPEAAALADNDDDDDSDEVGRAFVDDAFRQVEVSVSGSAEEVEDSEIDALIEAINACDPITIPSNGATTTMDLEALPVEDYGDQGLQMRAAVTIEAEGLPEPVELNIYALIFRNGPIGVQITASDGFDEDTLEVTAADPDLLVDLAGTLDESSAELAGS